MSQVWGNGFTSLHDETSVTNVCYNTAIYLSPLVQLMGQGRAIDEALRLQMSSELKAMAEGIHSALMGLAWASGGGEGGKGGGDSSSSPAGSLKMGGVATGDVGFAEVRRSVGFAEVSGAERLQV